VARLNLFGKVFIMGEGIKFAIGAAFVGIFLGIAGLVFGIVSKNRADQIQKELSQVNELFSKIQRIEESSDGVSASAIRIARDLDALKEGTQDVLTRVNQEMVRLRRDLNDGIGRMQGLEVKVREVETRPAPAPSPSAPEPAPVANRPTPPSPAAGAGSTAPPASPATESEENIYRVKANDTLTKIAAEHGVSLDSLMAANPNVNPLRLQIGQSIRIPSP